jgi:hypothetical protein
VPHCATRVVAQPDYRFGLFGTACIPPFSSAMNCIGQPVPAGGQADIKSPARFAARAWTQFCRIRLYSESSVTMQLIASCKMHCWTTYAGVENQKPETTSKKDKQKKLATHNHDHLQKFIIPEVRVDGCEKEFSVPAQGMQSGPRT